MGYIFAYTLEQSILLDAICMSSSAGTGDQVTVLNVLGRTTYLQDTSSNNKADNAQ